MITKIVISYLIIINLIGFFAIRTDKRRAVNHHYRIPEKQLFLYAILGGSAGCILAMKIYRHKTKHFSFTFGMPLILMIQVSLIAAAYYFL